MSGPAERIERARREVEQARSRLASAKGALQYRLKPATLASSAWDGVREKSGAMADDALQAVKDRPVTASGILAALVLFVARDPLRRAVSGFLERDTAEPTEGTIEADLDHHDTDYDLTAPRVALKEGAKA